MDLDFVSVHKHAKKELGQYPAILTSHLVNNPYELHSTWIGESRIIQFSNFLFDFSGLACATISTFVYESKGFVKNASIGTPLNLYTSNYRVKLTERG